MSKINIILILLFITLSPLINGIYFEKNFNLCTILLFLMLIISLITKRVKKEKIIIGNKKIVIMLIAALVVNIFTYVINRYAYDEYVDYRIIFNGIVQMLEMIFFYFLLLQNNLSENIIQFENYALILSGLIISILMVMPEYYRNGRFEGTFYYANALAIYLFICLAITLTTKINKYIKVLIIILLSFAIILTNSRFTYLIVIIFMFIEGIKYLIKNRKEKEKEKQKTNKNKNKNKKKIYIILIAFILIGIGTLIYASKNESVRDRFSRDIIMRDINLKLSYFEEAKDIIIERPFGLGYEGYLNHQSIKENKYRLRLVHNFIIQWTLNYGICMLIVGITLISYYIMLCIKKKKLWTYENLIILLVLLHSLQDVGLSFLAIDNMLIMLSIRNMYDIK